MGDDSPAVYSTFQKIEKQEHSRSALPVWFHLLIVAAKSAPGLFTTVTVITEFLKIKASFLKAQLLFQVFPLKGVSEL